ncbi:MAG: SRPBCC domain-containing protein [Acidimicrobiia bacterium]|nr:SRPBCC domain-containing protein [Acidimicrobiia bacterium]
MSRTTLTLEQRIEATPSAVFHAFTNSTALREWLCDAAMVTPRKDGRLHLWWASGYHATGDFTKVVPGERVSFTWQGKGEPAPTRVRVALRPDGDGTVVELEHKGIGGGKKWAGAAAAMQQGWETGLDNLRSVLETGHDLRFTRRPMLGILPDALTSEAAARLGVPTDKGILLGGVVEGMGAAAAGLRQGDVIVRIGKGRTRDGASLQAALQGHRAGDEVEVVYYRGAEKAKATMTLSARAFDEPPATASALAEAVSAAGEEFLGRLAAAFEGIDDERAARRPGEGQWSAREVLCHLISAERATQDYLTQLVGGAEHWIDEWPGNLDIAHAGLLAVFPTPGGLLKELRRNRAETWAMLAALPDEFVARKGSYWRMAYGLIEGRLHDDGHLAQIQAALAAE